MKKFILLLSISLIIFYSSWGTTVNFQLNRNDASSILGIPLEDTTGIGVGQFWGWLLNADTDSMVLIDISSFISGGGEIPLDSVFQYMNPNYFDTSSSLIFCIFADSTGKIDTTYLPFQEFITNHNADGVVVGNVFNSFDRDYADTLNDSIIIIFADSTGKIDTTYAPFQEYVANNSGAGVTLENVFALHDRNYSDTLNDSIIVIFSDSTEKIDTTYLPFQTYVANNGGAGLTLEGVFKFFNRNYADTLNDSIFIVFSDSTGKIDTGYVPFQEFIGSYIDSTTLDTIPNSLNTMISTFNGATYRTIQDFLNVFIGHGLINGGDITDAGSGLIDITAGTGFVKPTDNDFDTTLSFDFSSNLGIGLTDSSSNFIYIVYNGGSPIVNITTVLGAEFFSQDRILLGSVYRESNELGIVTFPNQIRVFNTNVVEKDVTLAGGREEVVPNTLLIGSDSLYLTFTAGQVYYGLSPKTSAAFNSDTTMVDPDDLWTYWYNDGDWQKTVNQFKIDSLQYNDFGTGLATLSNGRYGVHWVYITADLQDFHVVYGTGNYTLSEADTVSTLSLLPPKLLDFSFLVGKVIVAKNDQSLTTLSPFRTVLTGSSAESHNALADLQGGAIGEYFHLTQVELLGLDSAIHAWIADSSNSQIIHFRNDTSVTIMADMPVRITGFNLGNFVVNVKPAMSRDSSSMPAIGIATADIIAGSVSTSISSGSIIDIATDTIGAAGDDVYVDTAGGLTNVKPKAPCVIQKIGEIGRSHAINGQIYVFGAGRSNDVPQLLPGEFFYGRTDSTWSDTPFVNVAGPIIEDSSDVIRAEIEDSLDNVVRADGTVPMTGDLQMGGNNITGVDEISGPASGTPIINFGLSQLFDSTFAESLIDQLGRYSESEWKFKDSATIVYVNDSTADTSFVIETNDDFFTDYLNLWTQRSGIVITVGDPSGATMSIDLDGGANIIFLGDTVSINHKLEVTNHLTLGGDAIKDLAGDFIIVGASDSIMDVVLGTEYLDFGAVAQLESADPDSVSLQWWVEIDDTTWLLKDSLEGSSSVTKRPPCYLDIPYNWDCDSIIIDYVTTGEIDSMKVFVWNDNSKKIPDSLAYEVNGDWVSTSPTRIAAVFNHNFTAGERVKVRLTDILTTQHDRTKVLSIQLVGTRTP